MAQIGESYWRLTIAACGDRRSACDAAGATHLWLFLFRQSFTCSSEALRSRNVVRGLLSWRSWADDLRASATFDWAHPDDQALAPRNWVCGYRSVTLFRAFTGDGFAWAVLGVFCVLLGAILRSSLCSLIYTGTI